MAPRTFRWSKRDCLSPDTESINLVTLVFENSELFEAEAAELSVEESDDSSSLLIRNDGIFGEIGPEEYGTIPRSFHLGLSTHSLATTSIITPTHHAQTIEYNMISTSSSDSFEDIGELNLNTDKQHNTDRLLDFLSTLPVHILSAICQSNPSCSPSKWPWHLLAYTDSPAFVRAVTSDLSRFWNFINGNFNKRSDLIDVTSCDLACDLTTCQFLCCQAEVELIRCTAIPIPNDQIKYSIPSTSVQIDGGDKRKRHSSGLKVVPIFCHHNQLTIHDEHNIVILPLSGLHPNLLQDNQLCHSTFTAVYLLLINDNAQSGTDPSEDFMTFGMNTSHISNSGMTCNYNPVGDGTPDTNGHAADASVILALLVQILPSNQFSCPITIKHKFSQFSTPSLSSLSNGQQFTVLLAVVDLIVNKTDHGDFQLSAILHQRFHYLPDLKFELVLCDKT
uniref:Uncharacterized protein n=1 Tax=Trichobilharzia regenti TaxID=157069 RepID=A0AA85JCH2_TRIRE|nr:unnamed protein product [Trichobilharzia regenti]